MLHSFDDNAFAQDLKLLYELCFFCMDKCETNCKKFWEACQSADRDNITILMAYSLETFPANFGTTLTFFSLIAKTNVDYCKRVTDYLSQMNQYCEYFDLLPEDYVANGDTIQLRTRRNLFGTFYLNPGATGTILASNNSSCMAHKTILQSPAICWSVNFNCFDLIGINLDRVNFMASTNDASIFSDSMAFSIIELVNSILKQFFSIDEREFEPSTQTSLCYTQIESYINTCFNIFYSLINNQSPHSYRLLSKLLDLFNNIASNYHHQLTQLLLHNQLIGHQTSFDSMTLQDLFNNRMNLINGLSKQLFIFKSQDNELINNFLKLIDNLIKDIGNNNLFISTLCGLLTFVFPQLFKWKSFSFANQMDLILTCLNLLHSTLNTSATSYFVPCNVNYLNAMGLDECVKSTTPSFVRIDELCEKMLLNTNCSESLLQIIYASYEFSQDIKCSNDLQKLQSIQIQSVSLVNRLLTLPTTFSADEDKDRLHYITQSSLVSHLISSLNKNSTYQSSGLTQSTMNYMNLNLNSNDPELVNAKEIIKRNSEFLLQLNLLMSKSKTQQSMDIESHLSSSSSDLLIDIADNLNGINWFYLLTKMIIYKPNKILDNLLFSIFRKISIMTPRLFGSLLGSFTDQMHSSIFERLSSDFKLENQSISIICEFLSSLIEYQPGFFQILADIRVEKSMKAGNSEENIVEGSRSVLKILFTILDKLTEIRDDNKELFFSSMSGVYSIFNTIWLHRKLDYMNYCRMRKEFWPQIEQNLDLLQKEIKSVKEIELPVEYFASDRYDSLNQAQLESNIKCASYILKILAIEVFEECYVKCSSANNSDAMKTFNKLIFDKNLLEIWFDFYTKQLKRDLIDESQTIMNAMEIAEEQQRIVKADLSLINLNKCNRYSGGSNRHVFENKQLNSKILFDSLKTFLVLINKFSRLANKRDSAASDRKSLPASLIQSLEHISIKKLKLNITLSLFVEAILAIIEYIGELNNQIVRVQQEQYFPDTDTASVSSCATFEARDQQQQQLTKRVRKSGQNFITLKQSNDIIRQFHTLSSTFMIMISSIQFDKSSSLKSLDINESQLIEDLLMILEKLMSDDFNYFPAIINNIQVSILHVLNSLKSGAQKIGRAHV